MVDSLELEIRKGENEHQYIWRLHKFVNDGKMTWNELADAVNSHWREDDTEYYGESAYRKPVQQAEAYYADVFSKMQGEDFAKQIEEQKRELIKERQKLFATKTEYSRTIRQQSRFELFYENVAKEICRLKAPEFKVRPCSLYPENKCYVLSFGDIHAGACFHNDTNNYSFEEITRRFNALLEYMIAFIRKNGIATVKVVGLGDNVQGILRISDLQLNESTVVQATVFAAKTISEFLNELSGYADVEYYHVPTSNHTQTRPLGTSASVLAGEDVEYIIGNYIKDVLKDNPAVRVFTNFGEDYIEIPVFGFSVLAAHGHKIKSVEEYVKDISFKNRKFYDAVITAHFHSGREITVGENGKNDVEILVCPSFVGTCPYADSLLKGAKAACKIFAFDERYGHTDTYKIVLN